MVQPLTPKKNTDSGISLNFLAELDHFLRDQPSKSLGMQSF